MSIRITKVRAAVIDEYGRIHRALSAHEPERKRLKLLGSEIESWAENEPAEATIVLDGKSYRVSISAKSRESSVDIPRTFKVLGAAKFFDASSVRVEDLRRLVPQERFNELVTYEPTGGRRLNVVPRVVEVSMAA